MAQRRRGHGEGSVYKREDGVWCASIDLGVVNGKRRRKMVYGQTRKEVVEKLKALQRDQAAGVTFTSLTSQISTTMNIYAHVLPRVQREAITGLDALFGETKLRDGEEAGQAEE
jgi:hypothetical protein